jgi:7-carboxy-7-deazaguanine synthase
MQAAPGAACSEPQASGVTMQAALRAARSEPQASGVTSMDAYLVEVFSSVQGEGPELGTSTLFVRFAECDLRCAWCDTPQSWRRGPRCRLELERGSARFEERDNPLPIGALVAACERLELERHRWVSLTGGEPLLQPEAALETARALRGRGPRIWLESHGLEAGALARLLPLVESVSMDWKLASDVRRASEGKRGPVAPYHEAHETFLAVARAAPLVVVKIVVTTASEDAEIDEAVMRVARTHPAACLVLQPVTPFAAVKERPTAARMLALERRASERLADVRVIPQTHKLLGAL